MRDTKIRNSDKLVRLIPWGIALIGLAAHLLPGPRTIDDSFITYRYVRNILAGNGFVYNPGEHVLGTTTPLYALLLSGLGAISGGEQAPFPQIAYYINALFAAASCLLLFQIAKRLGGKYTSYSVALAWAIAPFSVTFAIGGLETSLFVLLLVGAVSAHINNRHILTALLASLAVLTRPDALILIGLIGLDRLWQIYSQKEFRTNKLKIGVEALVFLLPTAAWVIFAFSYFGSPLPHSLVAKSMAYRLPEMASFIRLLQHYSTPFMGDITFGIPWLYIGIFLYPFLFAIGAQYSLQSVRRFWPAIFYPWLYLIAFSVTNPLIFRWYLTPILPLYMLVILMGGEQIISQVSNRVIRPSQVSSPDSSKRRSLNWMAIAPVLLIISAPAALLANDWTLKPDHGLQHPAPSMAWYKLELLYRQAADMLSAEISPEDHNIAVLAAGDVGVLGYFTPTRILDTVGLNSPQTIQYYPLDPDIYVNAYAVAPDLILDEKPDFLIILEVYGRGGLLKDDRFIQEYTLIHKIPTDIYASDGMLIFARNTGQ